MKHYASNMLRAPFRVLGAGSTARFPLYNSAAHPNISGFRPAGPCRDLVRLRQNRNERFAEAPPSKVVAEILERHFRVDISY